MTLDPAPLADAILTSAHDSIIVWDDQGRIVEFNPAAERVSCTDQPETRAFTYHLPGHDRIGLMIFSPVSDGKGKVTQIGGMLIEVTDLHGAAYQNLSRHGPPDRPAPPTAQGRHAHGKRARHDPAMACAAPGRPGPWRRSRG